MTEINIRTFLNNFVNSRLQPNIQKGEFNLSAAPEKAAEIPVVKESAMTVSKQIEQNLSQNTLRSIDRAIYAKDLMQVPKNINEFIYMIQRGMTQTQFNQMFANQLAQQRSSLSQLQAQILAQLKGFDMTTAQQVMNAQLATQVNASLKNLEILSGGMINLDQISMLMQKNGKEAITKLIMNMTEASKSGITDLSQMKEMARLINASVSVAAENNPQKTLKLLLILYLPWLPLEDEVGFDLDYEVPNKENQTGDSILTITITTKNYGTVTATLVLESSNSVQVAINCGEKFPQDELLLRIKGEQKHYSMDSVITFAQSKSLNNEQKQVSASVNSSQTNEINPYLLLMAHTIIKHVIDIDKSGL